MANKSKAVIKETRLVSQEYTDALNSIIAAMQTMFNHSGNQISEIYRMSQIVSMFAGQKAYMDRLRQQFSEAKKNHDMNMMKSVLYRIENNFESRAYDEIWSEVAEVYDNMIGSITQESTNDNLNLTFKTAEEILDSRYAYYDSKDEDKFQDQIKSIEMMLNF